MCRSESVGQRGGRVYYEMGGKPYFQWTQRSYTSCKEGGQVRESNLWKVVNEIAVK